MLKSQTLYQHGDEYLLVNNINTDDIERENWQKVQQGNGFIRENGELKARLVCEIPEGEAAMLRANNDLDFLVFENSHDSRALKKLLARFPHWRSSSGGF